MKLEPDTTISHYKILSSIGRGGMGKVYLAQDTKLDRKVAIKFLSEEYSKDKDKLERFQQEAKAASALNHPNILTIYEIGDSDGMPYISSEFINGTDIGTYFRERKISLEKVLDISIQIAAALKTAHDSGIVHRDIKPENVMIREDGIVKILDFGLAKLTEKAHGGSGTPGAGAENETLITGGVDAPKTMPGMVMGTANYMSPEQARGRSVDQRTDVFSFGAVLYEMLTRSRPFEGETTSDVIAAVLTKDPAPVRELNEEIPERLAEIVERTLKKDKSERFQTSVDLLEELQTLKKDLQIEEIEKTILPADQQRETKILQAATADGDKQTTTAGDKSTDSIVIRKSLAGKVIAGAAVLLLAGIAGFIGWKYLAGDARQIDSIAVMPFVNESGNADVDYLSDGMTETLISSLSNIPDLSVKARSTVFFYKGKEFTPRQIGEELGVEAVLLGRFAQRDEDLKLSLELVDTKTQDVVWADQFNRKISDLISLQSEIARQVAEKITSRLSGAEQEKITKAYTNNPQAYQAYLKGRFYWNQRTDEGFKKGIEYFRQAIEIDPDYALAWSGLADSYFLLPEYGSYPPKEYFPKAKEPALKAIELDPNLAEAQTSLAYIEHSYDWKFADAEKRYRRAIELNPNYATAYQWFAELLMQQRRFAESQSTAKKAVELDPLNLIINTGYGQSFLFAGLYKKAEAQYRKTLEIKPEFAVANRQLGWSLVAQGNLEEALNECDRSVASGGDSFKLCRGIVYAKSGDRNNAARYLYEYSDLDSRRIFDVAVIHALLGEESKALDGLEILIEQRSVFALYLNVEPAFEKIRKNARYKSLMKQAGFGE